MKLIVGLVCVFGLLAGGCAGFMEGFLPALGDPTSPAGEVSTPVGDATTPVGDATSPVGDATTPVGDATSPVGDAGKWDLAIPKAPMALLGSAVGGWLALWAKKKYGISLIPGMSKK